MYSPGPVVQDSEPSKHFCNAPVAVAQELVFLRAVGWELQGDGVDAIAIVVAHGVRFVVPAVECAGNGHVVEAFVAHIHRGVTSTTCSEQMVQLPKMSLVDEPAATKRLA